MDSISSIINRLRANATTSSTTSTATNSPNACPLCDGKGYTARFDDAGVLWTTECKCAVERRNKLRLERSGLTDMITRYTLESYQTTQKWQQGAKQKALRYIADGSKHGWLYICGTPGSGKTHLCTGVVAELIKAGRNVKYMLWREDARRLKALVTDHEAYDKEIRIFRTVDVLYIDDFFKGSVTEADINLAFDLINSRYNACLPTVISGERNIDDLISIDEAIGSRIYERAKGYVILTPENANWRMQHG